MQRQFHHQRLNRFDRLWRNLDGFWCGHRCGLSGRRLFWPQQRCGNGGNDRDGNRQRPQGNAALFRDDRHSQFLNGLRNGLCRLSLIQIFRRDTHHRGRGDQRFVGVFEGHNRF